MALLVGGQCRVYLNGVDISGTVRGVEIKAHVGSVVTTQLDLICGVQFDADGSIRLEGPPTAGPLQTNVNGGPGVRVRAITFGDIPQ